MISWVPIYSCILVAVALAGLLGKRIGVYIAPRILDRPVPRFNRVLFLLTLGTALYFLGMNLLKWRAFRVYDDTAITLQVIHNLSLGNGPRSSVQASMVGSANYFACHGSLILYPVAVLYWLLPHPATVYACWGIMLATPVWMLGRWGRNHYGETGAGLSAPLIYLSLPTLQHAGLFELHDSVLAAPLVLGATLAVLRGDGRRFLPWSVLALLAREDIALMVMGIAAYGILAGRCRKVAGGVLAFAMGWYILYTHGLAPHWGRHALEFRYHDYEHLGTGPLAILRSPLAHPRLFAVSLFQPDKVVNCLLLALPLGFRLWRSGLRVLLFLPVPFLLYLANSPELYSVYSYYLCPLLPVLVVCALTGGPAGRAVPSRALPAVLCASFCATVLYGASPLSLQFWWKSYRLGQFSDCYWHVTAYRRSASAETLESMLPALRNGSLALPNYLLPRMYRESPVMLHHMDRADTVLLDRSHPNRYGIQGWSYSRVRPWLEECGYRIVREEGAVVLFRKP